MVLIVAPWCEPLELLWRFGVTHAMHRSTRWCALFNGISLRLMDAARPHSRRYTQFDLDTVADDERAFAAFSFVLSQFPSALDTLVHESDRHGADVCRSLKDGVLSASADVLTALVRPARARKTSLPADSFEQALTIVYRILFLLFAESRRLVPLWHPVYRDSYSIEALSLLAERSDARGLWDVLRAIARLAHAGCRAGDLRVTPFNGRLFAPGRTPLAERRDLDDEAARRALLALSSRPSADRGGREKIAYRDLGVEQLGAVYETLLDYQPQPTRDGVSLVAGSGVRKSTGTFYTPQPIADYLVRRTLVAARGGRGPSSHPRAADRRSRNGQRRVSRRGVPLPGRGVRSGSDSTRRLPSRRDRRRGARGHSTDDRRTLSLRRRSQSDGRATRPVVAMARHALRRSSADVSRPSSPDGRQPAGRVARLPAPRARSAAPVDAARRRDIRPVRSSRAARRACRRIAREVFDRVDSRRHD